MTEKLLKKRRTHFCDIFPKSEDRFNKVAILMVKFSKKLGMLVKHLTSSIFII